VTVYRCPDRASTRPAGVFDGDEIIGCGAVFIAEPDDLEPNLVDCPHCGIWFDITVEPDTITDIDDAQLMGLDYVVPVSEPKEG
jgi:hypothetical protein